ncbi:hypothetical protein AVEN_155964-1 [Araneus ventricosus]|uniref:Uncharacterized protein n=1 Tax=Araneus ventricosus TaxID=182803 RepID=A0A4Y2E5V3_ARAVE|nr:hypothetical protein AVEN_155964-1 [Araneus ventricosus]
MMILSASGPGSVKYANVWRVPASRNSASCSTAPTARALSASAEQIGSEPAGPTILSPEGNPLATARTTLFTLLCLIEQIQKNLVYTFYCSILKRLLQFKEFLEIFVNYLV